MPITLDELRTLLDTPRADLEKTTTISSDGKALLTRIPKDIAQILNLQKGDSVRWLIDAKTKSVRLEIVRAGPSP